MSTAPSPVRRSWTDNDPKKSSKWLPIILLTLLLIALSYAFLSFLSWSDSARTFTVTLSVEEYDEQILPQPAFATWSLGDINKKIMQAGLTGWKAELNLRAGEKSDLEIQLGKLNDELLSNGMEQEDTVLVYLRGHALCLWDKAYFLTKEFTESSLRKVVSSEESVPTISGAVPFSEIFRKLAELPAKHVVLIADVCDVRSQPAIGVLSNPVADLLARDLAELPGPPRLWLVTANSALQPTHESTFRQRTLLQAACEYACDPSLAGSREFLSLADWYKSLLLYAASVSEGTQTPLLFRNGDSAQVLEASPAWQLAQVVSIVSIEDAEQTDDANEPSEGRAEFADTSDSLATDPTLSTKQELSSANNEQAPEKNLWLRFWQLRDQLASRQNPQGWSPADFDCARWNHIQLEVAKLTRLNDLGLGDAESELLLQLVQELQGLQEELSTQQSSLSTLGSNASGESLLASWHDFSQRVGRESNRVAWRAPELLPTEQVETWTEVRNEYRQFIDATSQIAPLAMFALRSSEVAFQSDDIPSQSRNSTWPKFLAQLQELSTASHQTSEQLPRQGSPILNSLNSLNTSVIRSCESQLQSILAAQVANVESRLRSVSIQKLSWHDERSIQNLLWSTVLSYPERKRLRDLFQGVKSAQLEEPGDGVSLDREKKVEALTGAATKDKTLSLHAQIVAAALPPRVSSDLPPISNSSAKEQNRWGREFVQYWFHPPAVSDLERWRIGCTLRTGVLPRSLQLEGTLDGVITAVSNDRALQATAASSHKLPSRDLPIRVRRRDGSSVSQCYFQWETSEATASSELRFSVAERGLPAESPILVPVSGDTIRLRVQLDSNASEAEWSQQRIAFRVSENLEQISSQPAHPIRILPPNPDRVELALVGTSLLGNGEQRLVSEAKAYGGVVSALRIPAIDQKASSKYQLLLHNRSDLAKVVQLFVYDIPGPSLTANGRIDPGLAVSVTRRLQDLNPLFLSDVIELPAAGDLEIGDNLRPATLRYASEPTKQTEESGFSVGSRGLLCRIREVLPNENGNPTLLEEQHLVWLECTPSNPYPELIEILPQRGRKGQFAFQLNAREAAWREWGLKQLPVEVEVTDSEGIPIETTGLSRVTLSREEWQKRFVVQIAEPPQLGQVYIAHLSIGGYPRAAHFESYLSGAEQDTHSNQQAFARLDPESFSVSRETFEGEEAVLPLELKSGNRIIVSNRLNVSATGEGELFGAKSISLVGRFDLPKSHFRGVLDVNGDKQRAPHERLFESRFRIQDGQLLLLDSRARDVAFQFTVPKWTGSNKLSLAIVDTRSAKQRETDSVQLVLDRTPPPKARIEAPSELAEGEEIEVTVDASDEDSGVKAVYFAVHGNSRTYRMDAKILREASQQSDGKWLVKLKADALSEILSGNFFVTCRIVDQAGNFQDESPPRRISLRKKKP